MATETLHRYLRFGLDDLPAGVVPLVKQSAADKAAKSPSPELDYLLALCALHENRPEAAAALLEHVLDAHPTATQPMWAYLTAVIEMRVEEETEAAYRRDYVLYLLEMTGSPVVKGLSLALEALDLAKDNQMMSAMNECGQAEVLSSGEYPNSLVLARTYAALRDDRMFQRYYKACVDRHPRLAGVARKAFAPF